MMHCYGSNYHQQDDIKWLKLVPSSPPTILITSYIFKNIYYFITWNIQDKISTNPSLKKTSVHSLFTISMFQISENEMYALYSALKNSYNRTFYKKTHKVMHSILYMQKL